METAAPDSRLSVDVVDERGRPLRIRGLAAWLRRVAPAQARGEVTIALVTDTRVRALNRQYRRKDYATDVLSFRADTRPRGTTGGGKGRIGRTGRTGGKGRTGGTGRKGKTGGKSAGFPLLPIQPFQPLQPSLGDIVIARGVARRQAREAGHAELAELKLLALHGLLHLLGYDHERDNGRMRRVERRLRRKGALGEGLIERADR
jgi:probable rRNA maturation factor